MNKPRLWYGYDPMCSWCWAFRPALAELEAALAALDVQLTPILGGLAPDSDQPMAEAMAQHLQQIWRHIQGQLGTEFNFAFWQDCQPRRSTYPACRAALLARDQGLEAQMTLAIQKAYYLEAKNPSDTEVLAALAAALGMDKGAFIGALDSEATRQRLLAEIAKARHLGISGFPSLILESHGVFTPIAVDHRAAGPMLAAIRQQL
ncbi:DsbA family protein [Gallaecimonas xiamenensis]|uniref:DSBA-like thioredoxin domain-containing protein n=1 Tax=Gallaecimonas xiamenensis 3-C-1 TaxID=745411 RepID=K2JP33_9GAMM|nr:DsbA family protein [Gallaecimonas xiamenensis]EKE72194.1 hypothetical protein B3C1_11499 [Gallaecimonas xiamenensis 3-C-1]